MTQRILAAAAAVLVLGAASTASATHKGVVAGAATGAVAGAVVGGPVGAVVGAGVGAVTGHEVTRHGRHWRRHQRHYYRHGAVAAPCNPQSAPAGLNSLFRGAGSGSALRLRC
jgi:phage tail tape-measure protein